MKPITKQRDSKALIVAAAKTEFAKAGYAGARVAAIAHRAGVNKQLIFYYFGSKSGLYKHTMEAAAEEIATPATAQPAGPGQLRQTLTSIFARLQSRPEALELLLQSGRDVESPTGQEMLRVLLAEFRSVISAGQGVGHFRDDVDPDVIAVQAVGLLLTYLGMEPALRAVGQEPGRAAWLNAVHDTLGRALAW